MTLFSRIEEMDGSPGTKRESISIMAMTVPKQVPWQRCAWEDPHLEIMAGLSESGWKRKGPAGHRDIQNNCRGRTVPLPTGTYQRTLRERDRVPRYEPSSSLMKTLLQQEALR